MHVRCKNKQAKKQVRRKKNERKEKLLKNETTQNQPSVELLQKENKSILADMNILMTKEWPSMCANCNRQECKNKTNPKGCGEEEMLKECSKIVDTLFPVYRDQIFQRTKRIKELRPGVFGNGRPLDQL
jgi:hypothetical protein